MKLSRNQQHFIIMTVIYNELNDFENSKSEDHRSASFLMSELCECPFEDVPLYIKDSVGHALSKYGQIKEAFLPKLNTWKWERLPLLTRSILIMSYAHYYFVEKVDKKVVINIALNLAKKYIDEKQAKFINAILDGVLK